MNHTGRNVSIGPNTDLKFNQKKHVAGYLQGCYTGQISQCNINVYYFQTLTNCYKE